MWRYGLWTTIVFSAQWVTAWAPVSIHATELAGIVGPKPSTFPIRLAAKELRRYLYLRTGRVLPLATESGIISLQVDGSLQLEQYRLKSDGKSLTIGGGSDMGVLYGAYAFIEKLGVRFYFCGDVVPDERISFTLPQLDEVGKPLFAVRGIQPFHDFPEGPDWWNADDYKAYVAQLAKMKMNFIGMHTYPEGGPFAEPLVWIGLPEDVNPDGTVKFAYQARWANTMTVNGVFGHIPVKTSDFTDGAGELFPRDDYSADVLQDLDSPVQTSEASIAIFDRVGKQMNEVFAAARRVGVKTCIGTETPITIPAAVKAHLRQLGKDPADPNVIKELYAGMMKRIKLAMPADYYWLWTPEGWTWSGNNPSQFQATCRAGELGTIANLEQHSRVRNAWLTGFDADLLQLLGKPLPPQCEPAKAYSGPPRLTLLTVRGSAQVGEAIKLPIIALDKVPMKAVAVHFRQLGLGKWTTVPAAHVARAVYEVKLPAAQDDLEYYVTATRANGEILNWPSTAPHLNQTVVFNE
jgi:hypothetical protein